jgi:hypothetical protein
MNRNFVVLPLIPGNCMNGENASYRNIGIPINNIIEVREVLDSNAYGVNPEVKTVITMNNGMCYYSAMVTNRICNIINDNE